MRLAFNQQVNGQTVLYDVLQFNMNWNLKTISNPSWTCTDGFIDLTLFYPHIFENSIYIDGNQDCIVNNSLSSIKTGTPDPATSLPTQATLTVSFLKPF